MSFSHLEPQDVAVLRQVQEAMASFYIVLCRLPHLDPGCLRLPPRDGWPSLNASALKDLGKSDKAIEFARHLPCIVGNMPRKPSGSNVMITPLSDAVAFNEGDVWEHFDDFTLQTPPHVIAIAKPVKRGQNYLFLNTEDGTVFEHHVAANLGDCDLESFKGIASAEKWRALTSVPASAFFDHERKRLECLVYLPFKAVQGETDFCFRATSLDEEREIFEVQDEWEAAQEYDPKYKRSRQDAEMDLFNDTDDSDSDSEMSEDDCIPGHAAGGDCAGAHGTTIRRLSELHLRRDVVDKKPHDDSDGESVNKYEISSEELRDLKAEMKDKIHIPNPFTAGPGRWQHKPLTREVRVSHPAADAP